MTVRRVVVANRDGASQSMTDGTPPRSATAKATPGSEQALVWSTCAVPRLDDARDPTEEVLSFVPAPGETRAICLTIPPDSVFADPAFDPAAAAAELAVNSPGLAELFEPDNPGVHRTPTVDFIVVVEGELWLETDRCEVHLRHGDVVVQIDSRHAWRNRSDRPAKLFGVLVGGVGPRAAETGWQRRTALCAE